MKKLLYIICLCLATASCERRPLTYGYDPTVEVIVNTDWSALTTKPTGMSVYCYPEDGSEPIIKLSNNVAQTTVKLPAGNYNMLVFNQSVGEFATLDFSGMDSYETAKVTASETTSKWAESKAGSKMVSNPSEFAAATHLSIEVTEQMIDTVLYYQNHKIDYDNDLTINVNVKPKLLIKTARVKVGVLGFHNLYSTRATLYGMAAGYDFSNQTSHTTEVTHILEGWSAVSSDVYGEGDIFIYFPCFGMPNHTTETRDVDQWDGHMDLDMLLVDQSTIERHSFDLAEYTTLADTEDIKSDTDNKVDSTAKADIYITIGKSFTLPDVEPEDSDKGGFDATVEEWGDEVGVVVPM